MIPKEWQTELERAYALSRPHPYPSDCWQLHWERNQERLGRCEDGEIFRTRPTITMSSPIFVEIMDEINRLKAENLALKEDLLATKKELSALKEEA